MGKNAAKPASRTIREKETFRMEGMVNLDGTDTTCYVKASVNYERMSYKVQPVVTLSHGWDNHVADTFNSLVQDAVEECTDRLRVYREEAGIGTQVDMFDQPQGEPASN